MNVRSRSANTNLKISFEELSAQYSESIVNQERTRFADDSLNSTEAPLIQKQASQNMDSDQPDYFLVIDTNVFVYETQLLHDPIQPGLQLRCVVLLCHYFGNGQSSP